MNYKRIKFLVVFALGGVSAFSQTIQYKNELTEDWQTLDASNIEAKCLSKARALKLSGDFSNFKVSLKKSNGQYGNYETGLVINTCLNDYPDKILANYYDYNNSYLQEVDMSEFTGLLAFHAAEGRPHDVHEPKRHHAILCRLLQPD